MRRDVCRLLLHVCSAMTQVRNNIAFRAVNPSFSMKPKQEVNYTLPLDEFQNTLIQQTAARKATCEATVNRYQRRFPSGNSVYVSSFLNVSDPQFFFGQVHPYSRVVTTIAAAVAATAATAISTTTATSAPATTIRRTPILFNSNLSNNSTNSQSSRRTAQQVFYKMDRNFQ
jgi:hypothetical protein